MRVGNLSDRLTRFTVGLAVDVERASAGRFAADPQAVYARWAEFAWWAATTPWDSEAVVYATEELERPAPRHIRAFATGSVARWVSSQ
jgi:hypothetical protein